MNSHNDDGAGDLERYRVLSRREIVSLLREVSGTGQLVRMQANNGADSVITSILDVDEQSGAVIVDCAPSSLTNQRVLESDEIAFETVLENIRILFFAAGMESCTFDDRPALQFALPNSVIRLQRREFFRVRTPVVNPVRCTIRVPASCGDSTVDTVVVLHNVSGGGIGVVDEKEAIPPVVGQIYEGCRIDLPSGPVLVTLQLMNMFSSRLTNGKTVRRLGMKFVDPSKTAVMAIDRYITKLQREQNARNSGLS